jgi:hypothetical protein
MLDASRAWVFLGSVRSRARDPDTCNVFFAEPGGRGGADVDVSAVVDLGDDAVTKRT